MTAEAARDANELVVVQPIQYQNDESTVSRHNLFRSKFRPNIRLALHRLLTKARPTFHQAVLFRLVASPLHAILSAPLGITLLVSLIVLQVAAGLVPHQIWRVYSPEDELGD